MKTIMDRQVAIYIPSAYGIAIRKATKLLAKIFGGTTNYKTEGTRVNDEDELIREEVTVIRAWYKDSERLLVLSHMIDLALKVKDSCKQDCVAIEVEGEMIIV